jgi:ADP-ribosylglycohydrolase
MRKKFKSNAVSRRHFLSVVSQSALFAALPFSATVFAKPASTESTETERAPLKTSLLKEKITESMYAFVIADAMGGSVENNLPEQTLAQFSTWDFTKFLPPTKASDIEKKQGKGDGRTTDDTLNFEALIGCYLRRGDHLDANDYAELYLREITEKKVWIAEKGAEMTPIERPLWQPERYVYQRLAINNIEPRYAGMGNWINEGFQAILMPVGAVNVGDSRRAYHEATSIAMAHTESFGVECAGVNAAAYAEAFRKQSTIPSTLDAALSVARDGVKSAMQDVLAVTNPDDTLEMFIQKTREAVLPYLQLSPALLKKSANETPKMLREGTNIGRPSRIATIENAPIAFATLKYGNGDYFKTLKAGIFYGRDAETIAAVGTSLLCAITGKNTLPNSLKRDVDSVNRRNYAQLADNFYQTVQTIYQNDQKFLNERKLILDR